MANDKEIEHGKTRILVFDEDRLRLKKLADEDRRKMIDMFSIILDHWENERSVKRK